MAGTESFGDVLRFVVRRRISVASSFSLAVGDLGLLLCWKNLKLASPGGTPELRGQGLWGIVPNFSPVKQLCSVRENKVARERKRGGMVGGLGHSAGMLQFLLYFI